MAKIPTKLPGSLKVPVYADLVAAGRSLVVAACTSAPQLVTWSEGSGTLQVEPGSKEVFPFGAPPMGIAVAGSRIVESSTRPDGQECVAVLAADGRLVGAPLAEPGRGYGPVGASADGSLVAVASVQGGVWRLSIYATEDLAAGGPAVSHHEGIAAMAMAFSADNAYVFAFSGSTLLRTPVAGGDPSRATVRCSVEWGGTISCADDRVCVSNGSSAAVIRLDGTVELDFPKAEYTAPRSFVTEHAMLAADGTLLAVSGALAKHYDKSVFAGVRFPDPAMANGFVAALDREGRVLSWKPRAKRLQVRAMALMPDRAVIAGQDGFAEIAPWPISSS